MREYFNDILNNLDTLAGLRQLENIYRSVGDDEGKAITEINKLLTALCNVSKLFPFIPETEQQKIINQAVISEDFPNLNANLVYKWLNRHKDKYFKESHHVPEAPPAPPLTGEARQAKLKEWLDKLGATSQPVPKMSPDEIKQGGKEWVSAIDQKAVSTEIDPDRKPYTAETIAERNKRIRAMQEQAFRSRNPEATEEEVQLFMHQASRYEIPEPKGEMKK